MKLVVMFIVYVANNMFSSTEDCVTDCASSHLNIIFICFSNCDIAVVDEMINDDSAATFKCWARL